MVDYLDEWRATTGHTSIEYSTTSTGIAMTRIDARCVLLRRDKTGSLLETATFSRGPTRATVLRRKR